MATSSPGFTFDDEWKSFDGNGSNAYGNLDHLDLDDILGPVPTKEQDSADTINPQLLSDAVSPATRARANGQLTTAANSIEDDNIIFGPSSKVESSEQYIAHSFPIFGRGSQNPLCFDFGQYTPSLFSNHPHHRRSVSEPPATLPASGDFLSCDVPALPQPAMTFTRSGMSIGSPKSHHGNRIPRVKHPHIHRPYPAPRAWMQERYHPRRANTQPQRQGPTSIPTAMHQLLCPSPPAMMQQSMLLPGQVGSPSVTSRVCTPAPSPPPLQSVPVSSVAPREEVQALTIPLTVEELRAMITDAVQSALSSAGVRGSIEGVDVADGGVGVEGEEAV